MTAVTQQLPRLSILFLGSLIFVLADDNSVNEATGYGPEASDYDAETQPTPTKDAKTASSRLGSRLLDALFPRKDVQEENEEESEDDAPATKPQEKLYGYPALMQKMHEAERLKREQEETARERFRLTANARRNDVVQDMVHDIHDQLEGQMATHHDAPFWEDYFQRIVAKQHWDFLGVDNLRPSLRSSIQAHHRVLVLEPSPKIMIAGRFADQFQNRNAANSSGQPDAAHGVAALTYGDAMMRSGVSGSYDVVLELGLLDSISMGGETGTQRLPELRRAAGRIAELLRPGGRWIGISAVPPALRLPLLQRLLGGGFAEPSLEGSDTHAVKLRVKSLGADAALPEEEVDTEVETARRLRGSDKGGDLNQQLANALGYGKRAPSFYTYCMTRAATDWSGAPGAEEEETGLELIVAAQKDALRDDL